MVLVWKGIELLVVLVQSAGNALSKEELMRRVWPDVSVGESSLPKLVGTLREALGRDKNGGEFVETIPKFGYRFRAPVEASDSVTHEPVPTAPVAIDFPNPRKSRRSEVRCGGCHDLHNYPVGRRGSRRRRGFLVRLANPGCRVVPKSVQLPSSVSETSPAIPNRHGKRGSRGDVPDAFVFGTGLIHPSGEEVASALRRTSTGPYRYVFSENVLPNPPKTRMRSGPFRGLAEFTQDGRPLLRLDIAVQDARDGSRRVSLTETGTESDLPELVASATRRLMDQLGIGQSPPIPPEQFVLPRTAEGRRLYMEAVAKWRAFDLSRLAIA